MVNVYDVKVSKHGSNKKLKIIRVVSESIVHAAHLAMEEVYSTDMFRGKCVEITGIKKNKKSKNLMGLDSLFNDDDEMGDEQIQDPYDIGGESQDDLMRFKHNCDNLLEVRDTGWDWLKCKYCNKIIQRNEIQNIAGVFVFIPNQNRKSGKM